MVIGSRGLCRVEQVGSVYNNGGLNQSRGGVIPLHPHLFNHWLHRQVIHKLLILQETKDVTLTNTANHSKTRPKLIDCIPKIYTMLDPVTLLRFCTSKMFSWPWVTSAMSTGPTPEDGISSGQRKNCPSQR